MSEDVRDLLENYGRARWSPELLDTLTEAMDAFEAFDHTPVFELLESALMDGSEAAEEDLHQDSCIFDIFRDGLEFILQQHQIKLLDEVTLADTVEVVCSLYRIQFYEDAESFVRILECDLSAEEKLSKILAEVSFYTEYKLISLIESMSESSVQAFSTYFQERDQSEEGKKLAEIGLTNAELRKNLMQFLSYMPENNLAAGMLEAGFTAGYPIALYYPYIEEYLQTQDDELLAKHLLSIFFFSSDTFTRPIEAFRHYSDPLLQSPQRATKVNLIFMKLIEEFKQFKKADDDARTLSVV